MKRIDPPDVDDDVTSSLLLFFGSFQAVQNY